MEVVDQSGNIWQRYVWDGFTVFIQFTPFKDAESPDRVWSVARVAVTDGSDWRFDEGYYEVPRSGGPRLLQTCLMRVVTNLTRMLREDGRRIDPDGVQKEAIRELSALLPH